NIKAHPFDDDAMLSSSDVLQLVKEVSDKYSLKYLFKYEVILDGKINTRFITLMKGKGKISFPITLHFIKYNYGFYFFP
ncbi:MAG: hypothetical protein ACMUFK_02725, partial [Thermoplasmatota archaeon]